MELNKALVRWGQGQFCLITEFQAVGNTNGRYYTIRYSVGTEYGYLVKYSRKSIRKIFLALQKKADASLPSYQVHILGTFPDDFGVMEQHLPNHDQSYNEPHNL